MELKRKVDRLIAWGRGKAVTVRLPGSVATRLEQLRPEMLLDLITAWARKVGGGVS